VPTEPIQPRKIPEELVDFFEAGTSMLRRNVRRRRTEDVFVAPNDRRFPSR
jgi:hypothetical protein